MTTLQEKIAEREAAARRREVGIARQAWRQAEHRLRKGRGSYRRQRVLVDFSGGE